MRTILRKTRLAALILAATLLISGCGTAEAAKTVIIMPRESAAVSSSLPPRNARESLGLSGGWYGWWLLSDGKGEWSKMSGEWWDCCARISENKSGTLSISLWDEDTSGGDPLGKLTATVTNDSIRCTGGTFMGVKPGSGVKITLDESGECRLLTITGSFTDKKTGSFSYRLLLRPWGELWTDEELPYYYESWYLPLIEKDSSMPDKIGKAK